MISKKYSIILKPFLYGVALVFVLQACYADGPNKEPDKKDSQVITSRPRPTVKASPKHVATSSDTSVLLDISNKVLSCLKKKEYKLLADFVQDNGCVTFSAYAYIDRETDLCLNRKDLVNSSQKRLWGTYDGSGDSIYSDMNAYFDRFVYDADFLNVKSIRCNSIIGAGNSMNNLLEVYPHCEFVEYFTPGADPKMKDFNWKSLRLVFEFKNEKYWLVAIVHDEWTV